MDKYERRRLRLIELKDTRCGGNGAELARKIEREPSYVTRMLYPEGKDGKKRIADDMMEIIEGAFGLERGWLDREVGHVAHTAKLAIPKAKKGEEFTIPHFAVAGSMGPGTALLEEEDVIEHMTLKGDWLRKHVASVRAENLAVISGKGNSMSPTFNDGDLLLVDCGVRSVDVDGVYVLSANNRLFIKTVRQRLDGSFEISSDNPAVKTVDVLDGNHAVIVRGRVVWAWNGKKL